MDIEARLAELQGQGASLDEAVRQVFREDYSADVKELMLLTGKDATYIGRLKGQVSKAHGRGVTPSREPIEKREMEPPIVTEFKAALDDLLEKSGQRFRDHLAILFERQADKLVKNREAFESFLLRNGLTPVQTNGVMERIIVTAGQQPPGAGLIQTVQMPGGGYFHILQPSQPLGPQGQPIILQSPGGGQGQGAEQARLESRLDKFEEKLRDVAEGAGRGEPPMRRGRRPLFDEEGNIRADAAGNIAYEEYEEPWEPGARDTLTETLLPLIVKQAIGEKPKQIDEEALVLKIRDRLAPGGEGQGKVTTEAIREAVRSEISGIKSDVDAIKQDQARQERQEEIDRAVGRATAEHRDIIAGLTAQLGEKGGYKGLSDSQATMRYQKELIDTMIEAVGNQVASVREDIRPFILQQAVQSMKMQELSDEVIGQFLNSVRQRLPEAGIISESSKEEAVKRVKQWSKS